MDLIVWYTYSHTTSCDSWEEVYGPWGCLRTLVLLILSCNCLGYNHHFLVMLLGRQCLPAVLSDSIMESGRRLSRYKGYHLLVKPMVR